MTIPFEIHPDYDPDTWSGGYQIAQFGLCGDDPARAAEALSAMANPSEEMVTAAQSVPEQDEHKPTQ